MSVNSFGRVFRFSTWGESHGPAIGALVDGCPPGFALSEADIQEIAMTINLTPRKCLGYRSPVEAFL